MINSYVQIKKEKNNQQQTPDILMLINLQMKPFIISGIVSVITSF